VGGQAQGTRLKREPACLRGAVNALQVRVEFLSPFAHVHE
jgi:hypothetical protein